MIKNLILLFIFVLSTKLFANCEDVSQILHNGQHIQVEFQSINIINPAETIEDTIAFQVSYSKNTCNPAFAGVLNPNVKIFMNSQVFAAVVDNWFINNKSWEPWYQTRNGLKIFGRLRAHGIVLKEMLKTVGYESFQFYHFESFIPLFFNESRRTELNSDPSIFWDTLMGVGKRNGKMYELKILNINVVSNP